MPPFTQPRSWKEIDRLLLRNRKLCITELTTAELANLVHEMRTEVLAVLEARDEARGRLVESRRRKR